MKHTKHRTIFTISILFLGLLFTLGCKTSNEDNNFASDFSSSKERNWIGPEYWSNPLQDWQIKDGELQCLVSDKNRNIHLLTKKLDSTKGDLTMEVDFKIHQIIASENNEDWIGFSIGSKGEFNDYRDSAIFGKGLNLGISTNGNLFIDSIQNNTPNKNIQDLITKGAVLQVNISPTEKGNEITLSLKDKNTNETLQKTEKTLDASYDLSGDLVLVSH